MNRKGLWKRIAALGLTAAMLMTTISVCFADEVVFPEEDFVIMEDTILPVEEDGSAEEEPLLEEDIIPVEDFSDDEVLEAAGIVEDEEQILTAQEEFYHLDVDFSYGMYCQRCLYTDAPLVITAIDQTTGEEFVVPDGCTMDWRVTFSYDDGDPNPYEYVTKEYNEEKTRLILTADPEQAGGDCMMCVTALVYDGKGNEIGNSNGSETDHYISVEKEHWLQRNPFEDGDRFNLTVGGDTRSIYGSDARFLHYYSGDTGGEYIDGIITSVYAEDPDIIEVTPIGEGYCWDIEAINPGETTLTVISIPEGSEETVTSTCTYVVSEEDDEDYVTVTWHKNFGGSDATYEEKYDSYCYFWRITSYWNDDPDVGNMVPDGFSIGSPDGEVVTSILELMEDVDLYLHWTDGAVKVNWDLQGGIWSDDGVTQYTGIITEKHLPKDYISSNRFNSSPYYADDSKGFMGWSLTPEGDPCEDDARFEDILDGNDTITLYAVFRGYINVILNGGEEAMQIVDYDDDDRPIYEINPIYTRTYLAGFKFRPDDKQFYRDGYVITGWKVEGNPAQTYDADEEVSFRESVTLNAVWSKAFKVKFYPDGGEITYGRTSEGVMAWGEDPLVFPVAKGQTIETYYAKKSGYVFNGWKDTSGEFVLMPGQDFTLTVERDVSFYPKWGEEGEPLDVFKNADEVEPGKTYTDIDAMYKLRIDREGEFKFYVDTDVAGLEVPFYTDLTDTFSGSAIKLEPDDEYFFEYFSEGNGNIAEDGYAYFSFETSDEDHTSFAFRAYPQIRINAPDDAIHDGGATEDIYADKGSDRTFTVDASSPYGEIRYEWGIKDWSGATSEGEFKPLGDDTGTSTYTLKDIKYSYTELVCRMMVLSDDGTPMEETAKEYCFCIHVEGGDDPEDDVTEWGMYTGTVSTADTVAPGSEVTFTVDIHNTMDIASKPSVYVRYYQEKYNSETYPGVEFGTLTGEGYSTEDGTLSLEAYGNRTLTLTGTIPQTWNDQSQILLLFLDYENHKAGQIEYPVEAVPGEYTVTYKFVCESGEELPDSILALCPNPEIHYTGEWVEATYPARQKVDEGDSIWSFEGYDIEEGFQMGTADVTVTGTWMYRPKTDSEIAADTLVNLSDGSDSKDPNAIVDLLENANSSEILGRLEEILGEEAGNDEDGLNDALAQTTAALDEQLVDDSDVPDGSKKITVSSGSQTTGAYVGNTSAGQTEDGVSVAISGAAATVASVIRSQDVDKLAQNEDKHYQAVVSVDVVEKQNDSLTLDISLDVKVAETGQVVENDIDPVSPVTVTITLPDEYVGYDLTVIHTTRSGEVEVVSYSFINGGKQIRFTVSSLSPFELQILECMHSNLTPVTGLIATCAMDGRLGHWVCGTCGKKFLDEDCEQEVTDAQLVIPRSSYHTWNSTVTVAATEDTTGVMTHTCAVCGQSWTEVIPKTPVNITISKKPSKFKAKAEKKGKVTLTWAKLANKGKTKALYKQVKNIEIQYSTDKTFATGVTKKPLGKKKAKLTLKLKPKMTYYVRIRYADGKGGYSAWVLKTVKTKK